MLKICMKQNINIYKREGVGIDYFNDHSKAFIEYSNDMPDVSKSISYYKNINYYKNVNYHNPDKENKILIVFGDMIVDMIHNKKLYPVVTELFNRGRKLNISLCFYRAVIF